MDLTTGLGFSSLFVALAIAFFPVNVISEKIRIWISILFLFIGTYFLIYPMINNNKAQEAKLNITFPRLHKISFRKH